MGGSRRDHRRDIDGLRGVAVLLVVAFHAGVPWLSGGFVGVDVFFVISGFLITGLLAAEVDAAGTVRLRDFWARRIRRLVPALALVVATTLVVFLAVTSPLLWSSLSDQAAASAAYVSNVLFASQATDYFAEGLTVSPFLHTWSLGVEEQFYLCWPFLFLAAAPLLRRGGRSARRTIPLALAAIALGSFAASLLLTRRDSPWAFFSMPTRAWQFALAGLVAIWLARKGRPATATTNEAATPAPPAEPAEPAEQHASELAGNPARIRAGFIASSGSWAGLAGWVGLALILVAAVVFDEATPYPGLAAVVPTVGALLIVGSPSPSAWARLLGTRPLLWLGRVSYGWYLWHWPLIVLVPVLVPRAGLGLRLLAAAVALGLAEATRVLVEDRVRFGTRFGSSNRRTYVLGAALTAGVLVLAGTAWTTARNRADDADLQRFAAARDDFQLPSAEDCGGVDPKDPDATCLVGDPNGTRTVVVVGDSHAQQWIPALDAAGQARGTRVELRTFGGCPALDLPIAFDSTTGRADRCAAYRAATLQRLHDDPPDAVVLAHAGQLYQEAIGPPDTSWDRWEDALQSLVAELRVLGVPTGLILDNAVLPTDPIECLARGSSSEDCSKLDQVARDDVARAHEVERRAIGANVAVVDPMVELCTADACPVEIDGTVVFKDTDHVTATRGAQLTPIIDDLFDNLLGQHGQR